MLLQRFRRFSAAGIISEVASPAGVKVGAKAPATDPLRQLIYAQVRAQYAAVGLFLGPTHYEVLSALERAINEPGGMSVVIGENGTGKTTLLRALCSGESVKTARIHDCAFEWDRLVELILEQLGIHAPGLSTAARIQAISEFAAGVRNGDRVVLVFDEAQGLSEEAIEQLRRLASSRRDAPGLHIILAGPSALSQKLHSARDQTSCTWIELRRLSGAEVPDYVRFLSNVHNATDLKWSANALRRVVQFSSGLPVSISVLVMAAIKLARSEGRRQVRSGHVRRAAGVLELRRTTGDELESMPSSGTVRVALNWIPGRGKTAALSSVAALTLVSIGFAATIGKWSAPGTITVHENSSEILAYVSSLLGRSGTAPKLEHPRAPDPSVKQEIHAGLQKPDPGHAPDVIRQSQIVADAGARRPALASIAPMDSSVGQASITPAVSERSGHQAASHAGLIPNETSPTSPRNLHASETTKTSPGSATAEKFREKLRQKHISALIARDLRKGDSAMAAGDYDTALARYRAALALNPLSRRIYGRIRRAYNAQSAQRLASKAKN